MRINDLLIRQNDLSCGDLLVCTDEIMLPTGRVSNDVLYIGLYMVVWCKKVNNLLKSSYKNEL